MRPRLSLDFLRGALALRSLQLTAEALNGAWLGWRQWPLGGQGFQLGASLLFLAMWGFSFWALLYPTRARLQAVFILLAATTLMGIAAQLYWARLGVVGFHFSYGILLSGIAWSAAAWLLQRRGPRP